MVIEFLAHLLTQTKILLRQGADIQAPVNAGCRGKPLPPVPGQNDHGSSALLRVRQRMFLQRLRGLGLLLANLFSVGQPLPPISLSREIQIGDASPKG